MAGRDLDAPAIHLICRGRARHSARAWKEGCSSPRPGKPHAQTDTHRKTETSVAKPAPHHPLPEDLSPCLSPTPTSTGASGAHTAAILVAVQTMTSFSASLPPHGELRLAQFKEHKELRRQHFSGRKRLLFMLVKRLVRVRRKPTTAKENMK